MCKWHVVWFSNVCVYGLQESWYGMVWYGMVWYGMVWYGLIWHDLILSDITWFCLCLKISKVNLWTNKLDANRYWSQQVFKANDLWWSVLWCWCAVMYCFLIRSFQLICCVVFCFAVLCCVVCNVDFVYALHIVRPAVGLLSHTLTHPFSEVCLSDCLCVCPNDMYLSLTARHGKSPRTFAKSHFISMRCITLWRRMYSDSIFRFELIVSLSAGINGRLCCVVCGPIN